MNISNHQFPITNSKSSIPNSGWGVVSKFPVFMGIVNVTPDSFSDGGKYFTSSVAIRHALELIEAGAGIIDVGGESTRPGSDLIPVEEELRRVINVIAGIRQANDKIPISIDTNKTAVAKEAINAGANIINDIFSAEDNGMIQLLRETGTAICIMHCQGKPKTMQNNPVYVDVISEVWDYLNCRRNELIEAGIDVGCIAVDVGLGFGKTAEHNWQLVENIERFLTIGAPLLVGHSRKRFLTTKFNDREEGTKIVTKQLIKKGVNIIRIHKIHNEYLTYL
ncbi:MAG: dihydropteroate synthase [Planctomycetaceae bacterium]|jgi:dihydropteroate synthase|nr:dihydropteroate synthase [Planctomycetaceae bacterium]